MYVLNIWDSIVKLMEAFFESPVQFIRDHYQNPVLWVAFFMIGIAVFNFTHSALQKEK